MLMIHKETELFTTWVPQLFSLFPSHSAMIQCNLFYILNSMYSFKNIGAAGRKL